MKKTLHHIYWFCKDGGTETVLINWYRNIDKTNIKMDFEIMSDVKLNTDFVQEVRKDGNQFYVHNISYERNALSRIPFYYNFT